MRHYTGIEKAIIMYFNENCIEIDIEPHGSRGPDIVGHHADGKLVIGEIKSQKEIIRDLGGYWSQWNSDRSFGGKTKDYKLKVNYCDKGYGLTSPSSKGWVAVIDGQLRGYCEKAGIMRGVLVIENFPVFENDIRRAIEYLSTHSRVIGYSGKTDKHGIGYVIVDYTYKSD